MADIIKYNNDFENIIAIIEYSKKRATGQGTALCLGEKSCNFSTKKHK